MIWLQAENSNLDGDKNGDVIDDDETAEESSNTENVTETSDDEEDEGSYSPCIRHLLFNPFKV